MFLWCHHPIQRHVTGPPWSSKLQNPKCGLNSCPIRAFLESILLSWPVYTNGDITSSLKPCVQVPAAMFQPHREMSEGQSYPQTPRGLFHIQGQGTDRGTPGHGKSLIPNRGPPGCHKLSFQPVQDQLFSVLTESLRQGPSLSGFPREVLVCAAMIVFIVKRQHILRRGKELVKRFSAQGWRISSSWWDEAECSSWCHRGCNKHSIWQKRQV